MRNVIESSIGKEPAATPGRSQTPFQGIRLLITKNHLIFMEIKGKIYCFFEQSGTFKNEFKKLGYKAEDYDIQNEFGQTDHITDLSKEIEKGFEGKKSIFDNITKDDLVIAFFPCIYFCEASQMAFSFGYMNYRKKNDMEIANEILKRSREREKYYTLLIKMYAICRSRMIRMIIENPWTQPTYLKVNFTPPTIIDKNRLIRGDYFKKPTAYWFISCKPTYGSSIQKNKKQKKISSTKRSKTAGMCSKERSMISSDYARNFICDFILGKEQKGITEPSLFK